MTRRTKIRAAHVTAATIAIVASDALTSYATTQSHHTASGAWTGWQILGWLLLCLSGLWVLVLGCYGLYRYARTLWATQAVPPPAPQGRPTPGSGGRKPSLTAEEYAALDDAYRLVRIADVAARHNTARGADDTQLMLLPDIAELYDRQPLLIDAIAAYGLAPERVAGAASVEAHLQDVADQLLTPAAWDLWRWTEAA